MPQSKITELTEQSAAPDHATDVLPIVDVDDTTQAASGTTKKIKTNTLLKNSPRINEAYQRAWFGVT